MKKGLRKYLSERPAGYIYGLRAQADSQYFYIGSTTREDFSYRLNGHFRTNNRNKALEFRMRSLGRGNVVIELIEKVPTKERFRREYEIIAKHKADGHQLLNMVFADEPPIWVRTPDRNLRDLVVLLESYTPNESWVSWLFGCYIRILKRKHIKPSSTSPELFTRIQALCDPPHQPVPTPDDIWKPINELFALGKVKQACQMAQATREVLNYHKAELNAA